MENSKIQWTTHTFNPWHGCMKVSDGCKNCYAESMDNRWKGGHWGPASSRKAMSDKYWEQPLKWNAAAAKAGVPEKVFCASMADVFEGHSDTLLHLQRLFNLIESTPYLIWQLLTKRPENIMQLVPDHWKKRFPGNVWVGTSVENQEAADIRITHLLGVPAPVRFLSCEPLLGPVDLTEYTTLTDTNGWGYGRLAAQREWGYDEWSGGFAGSGNTDYCYSPGSGIHWVIAGGESGHAARPCHPDWVRSIRDLCQAVDVPFFFKQWGEWYTGYIDLPTREPVFKMYRDYQHFANKDWVNKGDACISIDGRLCKIGQDFMDCEYPVAIMQRLGKGKSGRLLDGREWNEFPK